jgi:alcohol dehydrogenase class IV
MNCIFGFVVGRKNVKVRVEMVYNFEQLVPLLFGAGAIGRLGEKLRDFGCKKVICIYDGGVKAAGIGVKAEDSLKAAGIEFVVFDRVTSDPPAKMIDACADVARGEKVDGVVGVGGGSSLDTAKAVAVLLEYPSPVAQYLLPNTPPRMFQIKTPLVLIPTTAGTGSEMTQISVISDTDRNLKQAIFVRSSLALVDPELTLTVPPAVTAYTGLDALAHAIESATCKTRNPHSESYCLTAISLIAKNILIAYEDGSNLEARTNLSLAANLAGIAFSNADNHIGHMLADAVSLAFYTPHGVNCALATPVTFAFMSGILPGKVRQICKAMGFPFAETATDEELGTLSADAMRALMRKLGIGSLKAMGIDRQAVLNTADLVVNGVLAYNCPVTIDRATAERLLALMYDGYQ